MKRNAEVIRFQAKRSWISVGRTAVWFATDEELIRVELDPELTALLRERIPEGVWP